MRKRQTLMGPQKYYDFACNTQCNHYYAAEPGLPGLHIPCYHSLASGARYVRLMQHPNPNNLACGTADLHVQGRLFPDMIPHLTSSRNASSRLIPASLLGSHLCPNTSVLASCSAVMNQSILSTSRPVTVVGTDGRGPVGSGIGRGGG